jgi:HEAT repeats/PBS lyase HEAT-like repeat
MLSPLVIVSTIFKSWDASQSPSGLELQLIKLGMTSSEARTAIDLCFQALVAVALQTAGLPEQQYATDVASEPIYMAALAMGKTKLARHADELNITPTTTENTIQHPDAAVRQQAAYDLGKMNRDVAIPKLLELLRDQDELVQVVAIQSLGNFRDKAIVAELCARLLTENRELILMNLIRAVVNMGDSNAVPALVWATNSPFAFVRHDAAWALGELGDDRAIPALNTLLIDTTLPEERNELGLVVKSSSFRVCDHAQMSLVKIKHRLQPWWQWW